MNIVDQLMEIGDLGPESRRDVEYQLASAVICAQDNIKRKSINWSRFFPWLRPTLAKKQGHLCCWCGERMDEYGPQLNRPTLDHVIPLSRSGADAPSNLAIACSGCNQDRGNEIGPPRRLSARQAA